MHPLTAGLPTLVLLTSALAFTTPAPAQSPGSCTLQVPGLMFGDYDAFDHSPTRATTRISVRCGGDTSKIRLRIELSTGSSQTFTARTQMSGSNALTYNIYADHALTQVAGDGSGGTTALFPEGSETDPEMRADLYGAITPGQAVPPGSYFDTVYVTLIF
ncbi:MAG: spore coat protein U domain-containing protein [Caulobacter sp.]|nr:spore coat protein U domain-containing protein [Caulobacter sp.]